MTLTDFIAVLSLILAVASLTWQAATFALSGSRLRADLRHGARNATVAVTGVPGSQSLDTLTQQGFTEEVFGVEVRNVGRLAAEVSRVQVALANGVKVEVMGDLAANLPLTLAAQ